MAYIDLDVCYGEEQESDGSLEWTLADMTAGTNVATEVVNEHGPGGGWPIVRFTGSLVELQHIVRGYAADEEDAAYHMRGVIDA